MSGLTQQIDEYICSIADKNFTEITPAEYKNMRYPKLIPMMKFSVRCFDIEDFGNLLVMNTNGMGGAMKLQTLSFTPNKGKDIPYLLIDTMSMKKKALAYVEYYDCTNKGLHFDLLDQIKEKYLELPDYAEKDAWYVKERMPASLIKGGDNADEKVLADMVFESIDAYIELYTKAEKDPKNTEGLRLFRDRMLNEGNPSSGTMEKVLGKEGYLEFYKKCIMPL